MAFFFVSASVASFTFCRRSKTASDLAQAATQGPTQAVILLAQAHRCTFYEFASLAECFLYGSFVLCTSGGTNTSWFEHDSKHAGHRLCVELLRFRATKPAGISGMRPRVVP